jgi:uncharacterized protein (DUF2062 family)
MILWRYIRETLRKFHELLDAKDAPHSVAGGTAIGVFFGFLPIFGLKTLSAMGVSLVTRCSVVASVIGVSVHDLLLPVWPLILRWQFQIGFWLLSHPHHFAPKLTRGDFKLSEIFQWDNFVDIGLPLVIGGTVIAVPISVISYLGVLAIMRFRQAKKAQKQSEMEAEKEVEKVVEEAASESGDKAWEQP